MNQIIRSLARQLTFAGLIAAAPAAFAQTSPDKLTTEPDQSLAAAHESFMKKDFKASAAHIHQAADYVKKQSDQVAADSKAGMKKAGDELHKFGDRVKAGTVKSEAEMKHAFARVDHQIADCWHKTAVESRQSSAHAHAALKKAGDSLSNAASWSNTKLQEGTRSTIDAVKQAGKATSDGIKSGTQAADNWFKGIGDGIKDFGDQL